MYKIHAPRIYSGQRISERVSLTKDCHVATFKQRVMLFINQLIVWLVYIMATVRSFRNLGLEDGRCPFIALYLAIYYIPLYFIYSDKLTVRVKSQSNDELQFVFT